MDDSKCIDFGLQGLVGVQVETVWDREGIGCTAVQSAQYCEDAWGAPLIPVQVVSLPLMPLLLNPSCQH